MKHFHAPGQPYMSNYERAGQFMPFMSLKGFDELIGETEEEIMNQKWVEIEFNDDAMNDLGYFPDGDGDGEKYLGK